MEPDIVIPTLLSDHDRIHIPGVNTITPLRGATCLLSATTLLLIMTTQQQTDVQGSIVMKD